MKVSTGSIRTAVMYSSWRGRHVELLELGISPQVGYPLLVSSSGDCCER